MLKREEVQHIANLARISVSDEEIEKYQKDISSILDYFAMLQGLETESVEQIGHITGMKNVFRSDISQDFGSIGKEAILKNAPESGEGYIKVKKVL